MKKQILPLLLIILLAGSSCSEMAAGSLDQEESSAVTQKDQRDVIADKVLDLDIEGMVCKMGCGGSIRKELKATGAVEKVEFDFSEEREVNFAHVYFNSDKTDAEEIVKLLSEINKGQFTVKANDIRELTSESGSQVDREDSPEHVKVNSYSSGIEMPNLFDLISEYLL